MNDIITARQMEIRESIQIVGRSGKYSLINTSTGNDARITPKTFRTKAEAREMAAQVAAAQARREFNPHTSMPASQAEAQYSDVPMVFALGNVMQDAYTPVSREQQILWAVMFAQTECRANVERIARGHHDARMLRQALALGWIFITA